LFPNAARNAKFKGCKEDVGEPEEIDCKIESEPITCYQDHIAAGKTTNLSINFRLIRSGEEAGNFEIKVLGPEIFTKKLNHKKLKEDSLFSDLIVDARNGQLESICDWKSSEIYSNLNPTKFYEKGVIIVDFKVENSCKYKLKNADTINFVLRKRKPDGDATKMKFFRIIEQD
jgi:hypothetical protein